MKIAALDSFPHELDAVAELSPHSTFYHTSVWLHALAAAYPRLGLRCLVARDSGADAGYLPFFVARRGPLRMLWSLPFGTYGGPASPDETVERALLGAFRGLMVDPDVAEVGWVDFACAFDAQGGTVEESTTHIIDLRGGFDAIWSGGFDKPRRRRVRRAEEQGVRVRRAADADDVRRFLAVYRERLDAWATRDGHPDRLFLELVERGGDRVRLYLAEHEGAVVGGHLNFYHRGAVIAWYGMASARGDELHAGTLLYATALREACELGCTSYNLGASLGKASLIEYKESLGGVAYAYRTVRHRRLTGRVAAVLRRLKSSR